MKKRNPVAIILLSIITFGIYDLYWLVATKKVLNQKTKYHTPTIWLLIIPYVIVAAGYIIFIISALSNANTTTSFSYSTSSPSASSSTSTSAAAPADANGEQFNAPGSQRPTHYLSICETPAPDHLIYYAQGTPECLGNDTPLHSFTSNTDPAAYSSPCETLTQPTRYVYVATSGGCPEGTKLLFFNTYGSSDSSATTNSSDSSAQVVSNTTSSSSGSSQLKHPALFFVAMGLIFVGFGLSFVASIFWFFRFSQAVNEYTSGKMSTAVSFLILWLIHLIGVALIQDTFNNMEDTPAATTPLGPAPVTGGPPQPSAPDSTSVQPSGLQSAYPELSVPTISGAAQSAQPIDQSVTPLAPPEPAPQPMPNIDTSQPSHPHLQAHHFDSQASADNVAPSSNESPYGERPNISEHHANPIAREHQERSEGSAAPGHRAEIRLRSRPPLRPRDTDNPNTH